MRCLSSPWLAFTTKGFPLASNRPLARKRFTSFLHATPASDGRLVFEHRARPLEVLGVDEDLARPGAARGGIREPDRVVRLLRDRRDALTAQEREDDLGFGLRAHH